jgi:hypothetical protein
MKKGDIVELVVNSENEWMEKYAQRLFEVKEVYERRCLVRMLNVTNQERYWFSEKENFQLANIAIVEIEEDET